MSALYSWDGNSNEPIYSILKVFGVITTKINLIKYERLSPDSFIWFFSTDDGMYCLYSEDYVPSLKQVEDTIKANLPVFYPFDEYKLVEVKQKTKWKDSSPVQSATIYTEPTYSENFMKYAATSGVDFVFLARSQFSKS